MNAIHVFTNTDNIEVEINKNEVSDYRGGSNFTTIYMKNGDTIYIKEDFSTVDLLLSL